MKEIKRRKLGNTGETVTEISLGIMNLRMLDTDEDGIKVVHKALDLGINLYDTAIGYTAVKEDGRVMSCETVLKNAILEYGDVKEDILIITKGHGYTIEAFDTDIFKSLDNLGIKGRHELSIGNKSIKLIYFFHGISLERWDTMKKSGVLEHAEKLKEEGLFTYLGFSSHNGHETAIEEAIDTGCFDVIELPYSVFAPGHDYLFKKAHELGIGVVNMKAFGGTSMLQTTKLYEEYCDISPRERIQYCLANPYITTIDAGCRFAWEVEENVKTSFLPTISQQECDKLVNMAKRVRECVDTTCRECTHCLEKFECPEGINFPKVLAVHTRYIFATEFDKDIEEIKGKYELIKDEAKKCTECGLCNEWCEYQLDIPTLIKETIDALG